jgi:hypothetical protein
LAEENQLKGLSAPNFYVAQIEVDNPRGQLKPGMVGTARIYGERRTLAGLAWQESWRFLIKKLW